MSNRKALLFRFAVAAACIFGLYGCFHVYLGWSAAPWIVEGKVTTAMAEMRTLETALSTYYIDHKALPPTSDQWHLLTPTHLITPPDDPFFRKPKQPLQFITSGTQFMIYSVGPDERPDLQMPADFSESVEQIPDKIYDATNGTVSPGDVVHVGSVSKWSRVGVNSAGK